MYKLLLNVFSFSIFMNVGTVLAEEKIKIGILATLKGSFTVLGEDALRGVETAIKKVDGNVAGKKIELVIQATDTTREGAIKAATKLIEQDKVDIVIGPLSSQEGIAIRDYSKTKPEITFLNGVSGAPEATYVDPSKNFFRFTTDNSQWSVGLGDYVFDQKDYKNIAIIADDYAFNHAQVFSFVHEYCSAGGKVESSHWLPIGQKDFQETIKELPENIDALYLGLSGSDALNFIKEYKKSGGTAKPIGSSITVDGLLLNANEPLKEILIGMPSAGPQATTWGEANWQEYIKDYQAYSPSNERFSAPSILATGYYNSTTAALVCLSNVKGDLSDGHKKFRQCLSTIELNLPTGPVKLDSNRQAIANNFVTEIVAQDDGTLVKKLVRIREAVNQSLGMDEATFKSLGVPGKKISTCAPVN